MLSVQKLIQDAEVYQNDYKLKFYLNILKSASKYCTFVVQKLNLTR